MRLDVATRIRRPGRHSRIAADCPSLVFETSGQPYVDRSSMSARAVISTATIDRVGDVLIPRGCLIDNYAKNPVVLWAHGLEGIGQPIGTSRAPDGSLAVTISDDEIQATSWFSQSSLEATQIFELIDEGIVRATSVRETPTKSYTRHDPDAGEILIVEEWELEEWSWCAVGVNPDAVAKTLHRNRLGGRPISQSIVKSLMAVASPPRRFGVGLSKERDMSDETLLDENQYVPRDDSIAWDDDTEITTEPYGSTVVAAIHASLSAACRDLEEALGPLENPVVKDGLQVILTALQEQTIALEGLYVSTYPDLPELKCDDDDCNQDKQAMKAFLETGRIATLRVLGLGARLKGIIAARNLTVSQRRTLAIITQQLSQYVRQSRDRIPEVEDPRVKALQKSIHDLTELVSHIKK